MGVNFMRHTKIVATVGPASSSFQTLEALIGAGVNVFRLNFSHGTHESHQTVYNAIRAAAQRAGRHVGILQDLSGPKIRTGPLAGNAPLRLEPSQELKIFAGDEPSKPGAIFTAFATLIRSAKAGDRLLLDDGRIELLVAETKDDHLQTVVVHGGELGAHKGINAPGVRLPNSAVTDKDARDLRFGLAMGVDLVALSFVQTADDVRRAIDVMTQAERVVPLIAKIERPAAVDNLDSILEAAQGVMVARGDLGLEMPLEQVPRIQKEIIAHARALGRPSILATQVFESMRTEPRPTRAEVSDAANAVDEGADAIMLAGETAVGAYPVRAVQTLDIVIRDAESIAPATHIAPARDPIGSRHGRALCEAAVTLATAGQADAIVAVTNEGKTARLLSSLRPAAKIIAATLDPGVAACLTLLRGVDPFVTPSLDTRVLGAELLRRGELHTGSLVVFANVSPELQSSDGNTNFLNVQRM
jgi:pyruvate kinase